MFFNYWNCRCSSDLSIVNAALDFHCSVVNLCCICSFVQLVSPFSEEKNNKTSLCCNRMSIVCFVLSSVCGNAE